MEESRQLGAEKRLTRERHLSMPFSMLEAGLFFQALWMRILIQSLRALASMSMSFEQVVQLTKRSPRQEAGSVQQFGRPGRFLRTSFSAQPNAMRIGSCAPAPLPSKPNLVMDYPSKMS